MLLMIQLRNYFGRNWELIQLTVRCWYCEYRIGLNLLVTRAVSEGKECFNESYHLEQIYIVISWSPLIRSLMQLAHVVQTQKIFYPHFHLRVDNRGRAQRTTVCIKTHSSLIFYLGLPCIVWLSSISWIKPNGEVIMMLVPLFH